MGLPLYPFMAIKVEALCRDRYEFAMTIANNNI